MKGKILSVFGGILLAALVSLIPSVEAACNGNCEDTYEGRPFKTCRMIFAGDSGELLAVECYYGPPPPSGG
jgi:hypothetical protein